MGDLVAMSRPRSLPAREPFAAGHSAEILFFTGVRYYRLDERDLAAMEPRPARQRRSTAKPRPLKPLGVRRQEAIA